MQEAISVLIPTFNRAQYIGECIESILRQTYDKIQIVVYDDGSTDNTVEIAKSFGSIKVIEGNKNRGVSYARNMLLEICNTEYAAWHDSDDVSNVNRIEQQYLAIRKSGKAILYCRWKYLKNMSGNECSTLPPMSHDGDVHGIASSMFRVSLAKNIEFDEGITLGGEDIVWMKAVELRYGECEYLHRVMYYMRLHAQRISSQKLRAVNRDKRMMSDQVYADAVLKLGQ